MKLKGKKVLIKVCAWCDRPKGFLSRLLRMFAAADRISHGVCWECQKKLLENIKEPVETDH